jgi:hypothetical protein
MRDCGCSHFETIKCTFDQSGASLISKMSFPEEQNPLEEPLSPIRRMNLGLAASFVKPSQKKAMEVATNSLMKKIYQ